MHALMTVPVLHARTLTRRGREVPETPQGLAKTLAPEHVPVFGGWDRGEVRTRHASMTQRLSVFYHLDLGRAS